MWISIQSFGQTQHLSKTWKSTNGLALDIFAFDTLGKVKREFVGDLWYYKLSGEYSLKNDTIKINYLEPTEEEKKAYFRGNTPPLQEVLYVINDEKIALQRNDFLVYLYDKKRDVIKFNADSLGVLNLVVRDFDDKIILMHQQNYRWTIIETWTNFSEPYLTVKNYELPLHSGSNEFRILVKHASKDEYIKIFKINSLKKKVNIINKKVVNSIEFTAITDYVLYDQYGNYILKGKGLSIDCSHLKKGKYFVDYDNTTGIIKKKN